MCIFLALPWQSYQSTRHLDSKEFSSLVLYLAYNWWRLHWLKSPGFKCRYDNLISASHKLQWATPHCQTTIHTNRDFLFSLVLFCFYVYSSTWSMPTVNYCKWDAGSHQWFEERQCSLSLVWAKLFLDRISGEDMPGRWPMEWTWWKMW